MFIETIPLITAQANARRERYDTVLAQTFGTHGELINIEWTPNIAMSKAVTACTAEEICGYNFSPSDARYVNLDQDEIDRYIEHAKSAGIPEEIIDNLTSFQANILSGPGWVSYDFYFYKEREHKIFYVVIIDDDYDAVKFKLLI